jgi:hypothetical protein
MCRLDVGMVMTKHAGNLLITHPSGRQDAIPMQDKPIRIGSAADNDMVLLEPAIAPYQASIRCSDHGDVTITTAGVEIDLPCASASAATVRIGGYVLNYAGAEAADHSSTYVMRQAAAPAHYARTDEAALLSALLAHDEWAVHEPRLLGSHEAATIEMPALTEAVTIEMSALTVERANDR